MKSKHPFAFWRRWVGASLIHSLVFIGILGSFGWLFTQWYSFIPFNFVSGIALAYIYYWAMPPMIRPTAKRWFPASIFGQLVAITLHAVAILNLQSLPIISLLIALYVPVAISQSWALSERVKKSWLFGLAFFLPSLIILGQITISEIYQFYLIEFAFHLVRAAFLGASLSYLQKYQLKETSSLSESHEHLAMKDMEETDALDENEPDIRFASRSSEI